MLEQEKSKYFVPQIEDIRVGYEYEYEAGHPQEDGNTQWFKRKFPDPFVGYRLDGFQNMIKGGSIRVPYLTKEQIEAEGWSDLGLGHTFKKQGIEKLVQYTGHSLRVFIPSKKYSGTFEREFFIGNCPSINEFRYICKLLGI